MISCFPAADCIDGLSIWCVTQGLVQTLDGLNIRNNALEFPPLEVLQKGTRKMLSFMRRLLEAKSEAASAG